MPSLGVSPAYCGPVRGKRRRQLRTAIEAFYLFSPCPGLNKTIEGGEEGESFGSTVPAKTDAQTGRILRLAEALLVLPKNLPA
jgi:hypothetical protein